jgi:hypothetical protein
VPVLPLIDFLIVAGTASIGVGFVLKSVAMTTSYRPTIFGFSSTDFALIAGVCLALALALVARTWVKLNEPRLLALERARRRIGLESLPEAEAESDWTRAGAEDGNGHRRGASSEGAAVEPARIQAPAARARS